MHAMFNDLDIDVYANSCLSVRGYILMQPYVTFDVTVCYCYIDKKVCGLYPNLK